MSKRTTFFSSSIGRKIVMAITGLFLITFLTLHLVINLLVLVGPDVFNEASHFMATNPLIQLMQYVLALGFVLHIGYGIALTIQNKSARPVKYSYNKPGENSGWSSRNMVISGVTVLLFLVLHLKDYFIEVKSGNLGGHANDYDMVISLFDSGLYTSVYVLAFIFLGLHLHHGFQSAFQSMGVNHPKYTPFIKKLALAYTILVPAGFALISIYFFLN
jgi:succinate dehydrogenase / fumarate reductase, cytochrome b subunit